MSKGKFILLFLFISICLPLASAGLAITISPSSKSLSLNHGQSESVQFTVYNDQHWCSISCYWELYDESNSRKISSNTLTVEAGQTFSNTFTFSAPTKESVKQASGTIEYHFKADCHQISSFTCTNDADDADSESAKIVLSYELNSQDKQNMDYIKGKLQTMKSEIDNIASKDAEISAKMYNQPKNLLIDDLKSRKEGYYISYSNRKESYNKIDNYQSNFDLTNAMNILNVLDGSWAQTASINYDNLKRDLDEKIIVHNELTDKINKLAIKVNEVTSIASVSDKTSTDQFLNRFENLKSNFESGIFASYVDMSQQADNLDLEADSLKQQMASSVKSIISQGQDLIKEESGKSSLGITGNVVSASSTSLEDLKSVCNNLETIKNDIYAENNRKTLEYNTQLETAGKSGIRISELNQAIEETNLLSKEISTLVNENKKSDIDYKPCQDSLSEFQDGIAKEGESYDLAKFDNTACSELKTKLEESNVDKKTGFFLSIGLFFKKLFHINYVQFAQVEPLSTEGLPQPPILEDISQESKEYLKEKCNIIVDSSSLVKLKEANTQDYDIRATGVGSATEETDMCCSFGKCEPCCKDNECLNDESYYPVIFLHGHSFKSWDSPEYSLDAFNGVRTALYNEGFRDGGMMLPGTPKSNYQAGELGKVKTIATLKTTYYYNVYDSNGNLLRGPSKQESIDAYAKRLDDVVESVKYRTGRSKVNIVSHSMGGLVARDYIKNFGGDASVNKLIMIGTPNHGIYGQVDSFCSVTGATTECGQMKSDSQFIASLNSGDETYGNVEYYTIAGSGCLLGGIDGDGISRTESVQLKGATNVKINGKCEGTLDRDFHSNLLDVTKYPQTLNHIQQF